MEMDPPEPEPAVEPDLPAAGHLVHEEPAVESAAAWTARKQLATHVKGPKDDVPRKFGGRT